MKIVIACSSPIDVGSGILTYCKNLLLAYKSQGHDVLCILPNSLDNSWFEKWDIKFFFHDVSRTANTKSEIERISGAIDEFSPDLVINNDNCFVQQLAPLIECRFVFVMHLANYTIGSLSKINKDFVDLFVAISQDMKIKMVSKYGLPSDRIKVIHNGLFSFDDVDDKNTNTSEPLRILAASENSKRKGADLLDKLAVKISLDSKFVMTWTKNSNKLLNNINYVGRLPKDEFHSVMRRSDVFLMPSREEGCPMALLEAMSYGLCPIVSDGEGAMKEIIKHGVNGFVCSLEHWDREVFEILSNVDIRLINKLGNEAKKTFHISYSNREFSEAILCAHNYSRTTVPKMMLEQVELYKWHRIPSKDYKFPLSLVNSIQNRLGVISRV